jgi:outer membrane lipoprotein-sorting protein
MAASYSELEKLMCLVFLDNQHKYFQELLKKLGQAEASFTQTIMSPDDRSRYVKVRVYKYPDTTRCEIISSENKMVFYVD